MIQIIEIYQVTETNEYFFIWSNGVNKPQIAAISPEDADKLILNNQFTKDVTDTKERFIFSAGAQ